MKRIPRTWLRLAFYLHNKSNVEHVFCHFFPYLNLTSIFYKTTVSSEEKNFFQSSFVQFLLSWQKSIRVFLLASLIKSFFLNTLFSEAISSPVISNSNLKKFLSSVMVKLWANVLFDFTRRNRRFVSSIVRRGFLLLNPMFHTKSVFWNFLMIDWIMVWLIDKFWLFSVDCSLLGSALLCCASYEREFQVIYDHTN